jgi:hypothetical protein
VDSCFFGPLFSLYPPGDHFLDPSHLGEDDLMDNNLEAASPKDGSPDNSGACYFLADSFALTKTKLTYHFL